MIDGGLRPREANLPSSQSPPSLLSLLYLPPLSLLYTTPPPTGGFSADVGPGRASLPSPSPLPPPTGADVARGEAGSPREGQSVPLLVFRTTSSRRGGVLRVTVRPRRAAGPPPRPSRLQRGEIHRRGGRIGRGSRSTSSLPPVRTTPSHRGGFGLQQPDRGGRPALPPRPSRLRRGRDPSEGRPDRPGRPVRAPSSSPPHHPLPQGVVWLHRRAGEGGLPSPSPLPPPTGRDPAGGDRIGRRRADPPLPHPHSLSLPLPLSRYGK